MTNESHEYQVVLEFHGDDSENFDRVIALEKKLEEELALPQNLWVNSSPGMGAEQSIGC